MKRIIKIAILIAILLFCLLGCGSESETLEYSEYEQTPQPTTGIFEPSHSFGGVESFVEPVILTINYYQHPNRNYDGWNIWLWTIAPVGGAGEALDFTDVIMEGNPWRTVQVELPAGTSRVGFIVRLRHWEAENPQIQLYLDSDENGNPISTTIYYIHGEHRHHSTMPYIGMGVQSALADWHNYIRMTMNFLPVNTGELTRLQLHDLTLGVEVPIREVRRDTGRGLNGSIIPIFHVGLDDYALNPQHHYQLRYGNQVIPTDVVKRGILDQFYYAGLLGLEYFLEESHFSVWAPTAANVQIAIYSELDQTLNGLHFDANGRIRQSFLHDESTRVLHDMIRCENGVWRGTVAGDLAGQWYMFRVTHSNGLVEYAIDPYVTAVSANGQLGAIITAQQRGVPLRDENGLNRLQRGEFLTGFSAAEIRNNHYGGTHQVDHIIYELHVRDFSIHPSSGISEEYRGTFVAFTITGTTVNGVPANPSTGIDHLVELGVTTVHLLPVFDQQTINEIGALYFNAHGSFNWGYDPQNFNVPEGSYSTDPTRPYLRIQELKMLIDALHSRGIRVVKDVVYNHTYSIIDGPFQRVVPVYYHRTWCNGLFSNGSGVGNEIASERPMVRRYIIDSLLFWQEEFGFDGFRFDLMWLHDYETMYQAVEALRAIDPDVLIYGEPWRAAASPLEHQELFPSRLNGRRGFVGPTNHFAVSAIDGNERFAFFNDDFREVYRGNNDGAGRGFATGASYRFGRPLDRIEYALWRAVRADHQYIHWASESINYASKHDNLILWDNISMSLGSEWGGVDSFAGEFHSNPHHHICSYDPLSSYPVRSLLLATGIVLTSQGVPFLHAGDEFLRSKRGRHNSFNAPDFYNAIDWELKLSFPEVFEYYRGLIELRRNTPAFRMNLLYGMTTNYYQLIRADYRVLAYRLGPYAGSYPNNNWRYIYVAYNGSPYTHYLNFGNQSAINVVVDYRRAGIEILYTVEGYVTLPPFSMFVGFS
ncbi:MAG: type I pullulanase [Defluviitaleaceae bacterium]|nr:type I pullulanase [Defluviitaleaceae bacterium]